MAHHRVEGVGRPVGDQPTDAPHRAGEERGDDGIGGVLGDRLDRGAGDLVLVELAGVPADEVRQLLTCSGQVVGVEPRAYVGGLTAERTAAEDGPRRHGRQKRTAQPVVPGQSLGDQARCARATHEHRGVGSTDQAVVGPDPLLEAMGNLPEPCHRVVSGRIAEQPVGGVAEDEAGGTSSRQGLRPSRCEVGVAVGLRG